MKNDNLKNKKTGYLILGICGAILFVAGLGFSLVNIFTVSLTQPISFLYPIIGIFFVFVGMVLAKIGFSPYEAKYTAKIGKDIVDMNKKDLENLGKSIADVSIKIKKGVQDEHSQELEEIEAREAEIKAKGTKRTAKAVKEGFTENEQVFCRFCGESIEKDSLFCKHCGKKQ